MAVLRIARMGNPVLLEPAQPVADPTAPEIRELARDMQETLEDIGASGLAAPQVFVAKRVDDARSSWAALLQHECDHLDGILYPMRMTDLKLLAYNEEPGPLAREVHEGQENIDPLFVDLVARWPGRSRWFPNH